MQEPAESIPPLDRRTRWPRWRRLDSSWRAAAERAVRALVVVMLDEDAQYRSSWRGPRIGSQSRHSAGTVRTKRSAYAFACGARNGVRITLMPSVRKISSKLATNFESRSWIRNLTSPSAPEKLRFARLLHHPAAARVRGSAAEMDAPALKLDEEEHVVAAQEGGLTVKKSQATMLAACARRNSPQLGPRRLGAGPKPAPASSRRTVLGETETPSFISSPAIRS